MFTNTSFRFRIFITLISIAVIPLVLLLGLALPATRLFVIERYSSQLNIVADLKTVQVNQWLQQGQRVARLLSNNTVIANSSVKVQEYLIDENPELQNVFEETVRAHQGVTSASMLHPVDGKVIISSDPNLLDRDWSFQDYFREGKSGTYIGQVAYSIGREAPILYISRPLLDEVTNELAGVIVVELNLSDLEIFLSNRSGLGDSGKAYLVDIYGFYVTTPPDINISPMSRIAESEGIKRAIKQQNGIDNYLNPQAVPVLGVYRWLEEGNIGLVVEIEEEELTASYIDIWVMIIAADLLLVMIAVAASRSMSSKLVDPLEKIATAARGLKSGDLSMRAPTDGPDEIVQVAASFNEMATSLQSSYGELESLVQQRTMELKQSEAALSSILQTAPDAIISLDETRKIILFNAAAENMFACSSSQALGKPISRFVPVIDSENQLFFMENSNIFELDKPITTDTGRKVLASRWNGEKFPAEVSAAVVNSKDQKILTVILRDITERNLVEEQIKKSLGEKEILLKEIHHRIKNNLQIISSLLYLQSKTLDDKDITHVLEVSQSRIKSMALIHESLYNADDLSSIDFGEYVQKLSASLVKTYSRKASDIRLTTEIADIPLSIDKALPLGLIINELISNSLKHGIPKGRKGEIIIQLQAGKNSSHRLIFSDDGIGMPDHIDIESSETLGLHLVRNLVSQLEGDLQINRSEGAQFVINFKST